MLAGPIDSINMSDSTFMAVGQRVAVPGADLSALRVGTLVTVYGSLAGAGLIDATTVEFSADVYVAGDTKLVVTGIPSSINYSLGTATIGELEVDYTPSLGGSEFSGFGAAVTVTGTRPALGGAMLGESVDDRTELFLRDRNLR
jgi:hypothetical protein